MSNFGGPAWTGLVGNPVPPRLRAQYFGNPHLGLMPPELPTGPLAAAVYVWPTPRPRLRTHTMPPSPAGVELTQGGRS